MFRSAVRRETPAAVPSGRHHRSHLEREEGVARDRLARVARARRRATQVGSTTPVDGTPALRTPAAGHELDRIAAERTPDGPGASPRPGDAPAGPVRIDNAVARRDPLTRPIPSVPGLPDARLAPDGPVLPRSRRETGRATRSAAPAGPALTRLGASGR